MTSAFDGAAPHFAAFLEQAKDRRDLSPHHLGTSANVRFIPRNFLLDERLDPARVAGYASLLGVQTGWEFADWDAAHKRYLKQSVFVTPPAGHDPRSLFTHDPLACPETFRSAAALSDFQRADRQTHLLRLVHVKHLAHLASRDADLVWTLAQAWMRRADGGQPAGDDFTRVLEEAAWSPLCDHRPVFAAFYEDFVDDLAQPDWPDRMRDRLGLYHLSQLYPGGLPARVLVFRYPVEALPRRPREHDTRLIAVPTVLDHALSAAFCPAPRELNRGRVLDLSTGAASEPVREIVHPFVVFEAEHLFRLGEITRPVPDALDALRRDHLLWLQLLAGRDAYARETDRDLLGMRA